MTTYVVLLRGINVGTSNRIAMADLRALLVALGFADVRTLLNSGNVVLTAATDDGEEVADRTRAGILEGLGLAIPVVVRSRDQLERIVEDNPLRREADQSPTAFHVGFCLAPPAAEVLAAIDGAAVAPDRLVVGDDVLYLWFADGVRDAPLARAMARAGLDATVTMRNWNTVLKLAAAARG